jgi:hypothetical protein
MTRTVKEIQGDYAVANLGIFLVTLSYQCLGNDWKILSRIDPPWMNTALFVSLSLICTLPRLYIDAVSLYPHANNYTYFHSKRKSAAFAFIYIWLETFMARKLQPLFQFFVAAAGPDLSTIHGTEQFMVSILAWELELPFAWAFLFFHTVGSFVHQPLRQLWKGTSETSLSIQLRVNLGCCAAIYLVLRGLHYASPWYFYRTMVGLNWAVGLLLLLSYSAFTVSENRERNHATTVDASGRLVYKTLKSPKAFRLLRIFKSRRFDHPVQCELLEISSVSDAPSQYRTVSYRWDTSLGKVSTITVNGETLMVYPNLEKILRDIRAKYWSQLVWIDQLCIDQENATEKSAQVAMMGQIYQSAAEVRVCLPVSDLADYGFWKGWRDSKLSPKQREIRDAAALIRRLGHSRLLQDYTPGNERGNLLSYARLHDWKVLGDLLEHPWFHRVWMIQEIGMASNHVQIHYGQESFNWDDFVLAMAVLARSELRRFSELLSADKYKEKEFPAIENVLIMENMRNEAERLSLFENLILCQRFEATEQVDKIYALLGVSSKQDSVAHKFKIDYNSSPFTVFVDLATALLEGAPALQQFRILRFAGEGQGHIPNLPSFVPDWSIRTSTSTLEHRDAEMDFAASPVTGCCAELGLIQFGEIERKVLKAQGYGIDRIKFLVDLSEVPSTTSTTPFLDAFAISHQAKQPYFTQQSHEEAFWRTIIADTHPLKRPASENHWRHWKSFFTRSDELRAKERTINEENEFDGLCRTLRFISSADLIFTHLLATDLSKQRSSRIGGFKAVLNRSFDYSFENDPRVTQGRQFCVTEDGYMGLVPKCSKIGDAIVILHGAKTPHVVRGLRFADYSYKFADFPCCQLIGEAYIHGLMHNTEDTLRNYTQTVFPII